MKFMEMITHFHGFDSEMTITVLGLAISPTLGYSVMNKGSFTGIIGLEAQYKNCTYGVSFAYQKESHQYSKKIMADFKLTF